MSAGGGQSGGNAIGVGRARGARRPARVPVRWQVLVELVDVEGLHVGHHLVADLADVHVAKVDVGLPPSRSGARSPLPTYPQVSAGPSSTAATLPLPLSRLPGLKLCLRRGGGCGWAVALACGGEMGNFVQSGTKQVGGFTLKRLHYNRWIQCPIRHFLNRSADGRTQQLTWRV